LAKIVVDEDIARSTGRLLIANGHQVFDIRDHGLRGAKDEDIFRFAQTNNASLLTGDMDFGNLIKYPLGRHFGIIIFHFPSVMPIHVINPYVLGSFKQLMTDDIHGNLIVLEPGKIRIRRSKT